MVIMFRKKSETCKDINMYIHLFEVDRDKFLRLLHG